MTAALGFDSSVLSPFARAGRLDVLERLTDRRRCIVTPAVLDELDRGCVKYPRLADVRAVSWLQVVEANSLEELRAFGRYVRVLGAGRRDIGEASVLAWAEIAAGIAVIDDNAAVNAARTRNVQVRRSLGLLCHGLHRNILRIDQACALVDELVTMGGARFPCDGASFVAWAERNGFLAAG